MRSQAFVENQSRTKRGLSSHITDEEKLWKKLWSIKAPGKMKITLWRFAHDCLPSGTQLRQRNIPVASDACLFCNREESSEHTLMFCPYAAEVWRAVKSAFPLHLRRKDFSTTKSWVLDFLARSCERELVTMAVTVWHLWEARNGVRNEEKRRHPNSLAEQIKVYIELILLHLLKNPTVQRRESSSTSHWSPPPTGTAVVNSDAALFSSSSRMGVGVVIRDHTGSFLAACSKLLDEVTSPEIAEALAIRSAISLARDEGLNDFILVSDCLSVIQRIQSPVRDRSMVGVVVEDIKILAASLSSVTFRHVSRHCNNSAHAMARRAELSGSCFFHGVAPKCIRDKLCIDYI
uniref:Uncharacterized protein n=3 Tax=Avena sativa TaxID=4498 RepID=A0ACD5XPQ5_AVESA